MGSHAPGLVGPRLRREWLQRPAHFCAGGAHLRLHRDASNPIRTSGQPHRIANPGIRTELLPCRRLAKAAADAIAEKAAQAKALVEATAARIAAAAAEAAAAARQALAAAEAAAKVAAANIAAGIKVRLSLRSRNLGNSR